MTDQELKDLVASLAVKSDRLDAQLASYSAELRAAQLKTDAQLAAVGARLDAVGIKLNHVAQMLGSVANSNGEVTEEFFFNSLKREPHIGGLHFDQVKSNVIVKESGEKKAELDIVLLNGQCAAVIEVKHRPQKKDIEQLLSAIASYKSSLPKDKQGKKYKIYGGIAGFSVPKSIVSLAKDNGLLVLKQSGLLISSQTEGMTAF